MTTTDERMFEIMEWLAVTQPITLQMVYRYDTLIKAGIELGASNEEIIAIINEDIESIRTRLRKQENKLSWLTLLLTRLRPVTRRHKR